MTLGKVIGNIIASTTAVDYISRTVLIIQPIDPNGNAKGKSFLAIDTVQAGIGDIVLTLDEGSSAKAALNEPNTHSVKVVIVGIVDHIVKEI